LEIRTDDNDPVRYKVRTNLSVINKYAGDIINQSIIMSEKRENREEQKLTDFMYITHQIKKERERKSKPDKGKQEGINR
jgi:hypothetical protein